MQGKTTFTDSEAAEIRDLLTKKARSAGDAQKTIRAKIRRLGFYISDFTNSGDGFLCQDFDALVAKGSISIPSTLKPDA